MVRFFVSARFVCWDSSITAQIAVLDCWDWHAEVFDWHAEVFVNIPKCPTEIGEYLEYEDISWQHNPSVIWEILLLSCVQQRRGEV